MTSFLLFQEALNFVVLSRFFSNKQQAAKLRFFERDYEKKASLFSLQFN